MLPRGRRNKDASPALEHRSHFFFVNSEGNRRELRLFRRVTLLLKQALGQLHLPVQLLLLAALVSRAGLVAEVEESRVGERGLASVMH